MTKQETTGNIVTDGSGSQIANLKASFNKKFSEVNIVVLTVVVILLVMVATLVIDSFHFNSATYREYSEKIQTLDSIQNSNQTLMEQNKKNQELILEQQNQIIKLLNERAK